MGFKQALRCKDRRYHGVLFSFRTVAVKNSQYSTREGIGISAGCRFSEIQHWRRKMKCHRTFTDLKLIKFYILKTEKNSGFQNGK